MELDKVLHVAANEIRKFYYQPNLRHVDDYELEEFAANYGIRTQYGSLVFTSNVRSSSLPLTVYVGGKGISHRNPTPVQSRILRELPQTLAKVQHYAKKVPFTCIEKRMCNNDDFNLHCALFTSLYKKESVRLPFFWGQSLFAAHKRRSLKLHLVCIPEWPASQRQIIVFPELGITYMLGSDYFEDIRDSFLRMGMYFAKTNGMQAIYGASKIITCYNTREKKSKNYAALFIGPSRVDKTFCLADNFSLSGKGENVKLLQDGVLFIRKYNQVFGTEKIFSVKVQELESYLHTMFYRAAFNRKTNFENVIIDHQGRLDFQDLTITDSGKAFIQVRDLARLNQPVFTDENHSEDINISSIEKMDGLKIFIMTKMNSIVPPVCKLEPRQAAAVFMLGESVEDNKIHREPASNPYLVGNAEEEAEGFLNFLGNNRQKVEIYLLNTGSVGYSVNQKLKKKRKSRPKKIETKDVLSVCEAIFREDIKWEKTRYWQVLVPKIKGNVNLKKYALENFYGADDIKKAVLHLRSERQEYLLKNFPKLSSYIKKAVI